MWNQKRKALAVKYTQALSGLDVVTPFVPDWADPVWHLYVIRVAKRDLVLEKLKSAGVGAGIHYPIPLHLQPAYRYLGYQEGDFPITEQAASEVLSLPLYPEMTDEQLQFVVRTLESILDH